MVILTVQSSPLDIFKNHSELAAELQTEPPFRVASLCTFLATPFVSNFYPWETKTEARKKPRRRPNQNQSQSQAAGKYLRRLPRQNRAFPEFTPNARPRKRRRKALSVPRAGLSHFRSSSPLFCRGLRSAPTAGQIHSARIHITAHSPQKR